MTKISLQDIKSKMNVGFGTSGIRAKNEELTDMVVYIYTRAFLKIAGSIGKVVVAGDLRKSTDKIMVAVSKAVVDAGGIVVNVGKVPTPTACYYGFQNGWPSVVVTGSHIPEDRNGVKFQLADREILKEDEKTISESNVEIDETLFDNAGGFVDNFESCLTKITDEAKEMYINRYLNFFDSNLFCDKTVGLYGHSAVGRDIYERLLNKLGATVVKIDFSDAFVPIDTETVDTVLIEKGKVWKKTYNLDLILSTDGDGDRPLLADEEGKWIRSELLPILTAKFLGIDDLAITLSSNTAVEKTGWFKKIVKTKVGSPYVISGINELIAVGGTKVAGYEANGGFLLGTKVGNLNPLPTRDALITILSVPAMAKGLGKKISDLVSDLPNRYTYSLSIKGIPTEKSLMILANWEDYKVDIEDCYGAISEVDQMDGLRLTFENDDIVHFRPSKNSPEFRNYTESATEERAKELAEKAIELIKKWNN